MVSEARKQATKKWNAKNTKTTSCCLKIDEYEEFQKYAKNHGTTMSALLLKYVRNCIREDEQEEDKEE